MSREDDLETLESALADFISRRESGEAMSVSAFVQERCAAGLSEQGAIGLRAALAQLDQTEGLFPAVDPPSSRVIGPYRILSELGRGGMGRVFKVEHRDEPGSRYALKMLSLGAQLDQRLRKRFERECSEVMQLDHPGLVHIREVAVQGDEPYLVMDLVEGKTLAQLIGAARHSTSADVGAVIQAESLELEGPGGPYARVARMGARLARAVSELHARKIIHRDIKPSNVIVGAEGEPVLIDFGLATNEDSSRLTGTGDLLGTPHYMAPEQARGEPCDERVDIYALGVILHELLCLDTPHTGSDALLILDSIRSRPARPVRRQQPESPGQLARVIDRCLAFRRESRYSSAMALAEDLEAFAAGEKVQARSMWLARLELSLRRRARSLALSALLAAALGFSGWQFWSNAANVQAATLRQAIDRAAMSWGLNDLEETRRSAQQVLTLDGGNATGEFLLTISEGSMLVDSEDASIEALLRGMRFRNEGRNKEAKQQFRLAASLAPSSPLPLVMSSKLATELGEVEEGVRLLEEASRHDPSSAAYARELGQAYYDLERFQLAEEAFLRATQNDPEYPRSWFDLARTRIITQDHRSGLETMQAAALRLGKSCDRLLSILCAQLIEEKEYELARGALLSLSERRGPDASLFVEIARSYDFAEQLAQAVIWYHQAIELEPNHQEALKALLHLHTGANRETCEDCAAAFERTPELFDPDEAVRCGLLLLEINHGKSLGLTLWIVEKFQLLGRASEARARVETLLQAMAAGKARENLQLAFAKLSGK